MGDTKRACFLLEFVWTIRSLDTSFLEEVKCLLPFCKYKFTCIMSSWLNWIRLWHINANTITCLPCKWCLQPSCLSPTPLPNAFLSLMKWKTIRILFNRRFYNKQWKVNLWFYSSYSYPLLHGDPSLGVTDFLLLYPAVTT